MLSMTVRATEGESGRPDRDGLRDREGDIFPTIVSDDLSRVGGGGGGGGGLCGDERRSGVVGDTDDAVGGAV